MKIRILQMFCLFIFLVNVQASAQIGYQVSLLNSATGEPRVHATVNAQVALTNSLDEVILTESKAVTSNDFGVLSFTIGDENTLKEVDWNKLPFYISVKVDGVLIGKSQVLSVPVAEYAKQAGPVVTKDVLVGKKWVSKQFNYEGVTEFWFRFYDNGAFVHRLNEMTECESCYSGTYLIVGDEIVLFYSMDNSYSENGEFAGILKYIPFKNILVSDGSAYSMDSNY